MVERTMLEFNPVVAGLVRDIAEEKGLKIKVVSDKFMRFAIPHYQMILADLKNESGAGEMRTRARQYAKHTPTSATE
jgi:hypothetical protein